MFYVLCIGLSQLYFMSTQYKQLTGWNGIDTVKLYAPLYPKALGSSPVTDHFSDLIFNIFSLYIMLLNYTR